MQLPFPNSRLIIQRNGAAMCLLVRIQEVIYFQQKGKTQKGLPLLYLYFEIKSKIEIIKTIIDFWGLNPAGRSVFLIRYLYWFSLILNFKYGKLNNCDIDTDMHVCFQSKDSWWKVPELLLSEVKLSISKVDIYACKLER